MLYTLFYNILKIEQHVSDIVLCQYILINLIPFTWQMVLQAFGYKVI